MNSLEAEIESARESDRNKKQASSPPGVELFPHNLQRVSVVPQSGKARVPQVTIRRPHRKLDLRHELPL
jgi:hypothetical protein